MSYVLRPRAKADLLSIAKHIADLPEIGQPRDDVRRGLRTFPKGNYLIVFETKNSEARILRVVHGARDWPKLVR